MKDKAERIDWTQVTEKAREAYMLNSAAIDWGDFWEGYLNGYKAAFEEYR